MGVVPSCMIEAAKTPEKFAYSNELRHNLALEKEKKEEKEDEKEEFCGKTLRERTMSLETQADSCKRPPSRIGRSAKFDEIRSEEPLFSPSHQLNGLSIIVPDSPFRL